MGAEDFSFYQEKIQGYTFFWGAQRQANIWNSSASYSRFYIDESGFVLEWKCQTLVDYKCNRKNKTSKK
jgi:metal-dependent amidase/aminoacylase/carboxypeptidase family protein